MPKEVNKDKAKPGRDTSTAPEDADGVHAVLWTRRPVCGPRTEVVDRLGALRTADAIADFAVKTWPDEVTLSGHTREERVVATYERFSAWADEAGVSITPPFEHRTVSTLVGRREEVLRLPIMCLAVYDGDVRGVYPCSDGDVTWTVADYLDALETAGGRPAREDVDWGLPTT